MSVRLVGETRLGKRVVFGLAGALVLAMLVGILTGGFAGDVPPVFAASCVHGVNYFCGAGDPNKTSALEVSHHTSPRFLGTSTVVEPDDGESWSITAQWCPNPYGPEVLETASATVSWNGSSWVLSNVSTTTNITAISICQGDTCDAGGGSVHSWEYTLIVNVTDVYPVTGANLAQVTYTTTSVDDGYTIEDPTETYGDCYTDTSVSPTSQTFSASDSNSFWGANRCPFNCTVTGASLTIYYE